MEISYKPNLPFVKNHFTCGSCLKKPAKYICPKCKLPYCGIQCYKVHSPDCSEEFYKDQVFTLLKNRKPSKSDIKNISEILNSTQEKNDPILSEILEENTEKRIQELEKILEEPKGNYLEVLNYDEKVEFANFIKSGKITKYLTQWTPWWIEENFEIGSLSQSEKYLAIPDIKSLNKRPSEFVKYHILELVWSNVFVWRMFNGEIDENLDEIISITINLSQVLKNRVTNLENIETCLNPVLEEAYRIDKEVAQGISIAVIYDTYLIFRNKWYLLTILFEIFEFFQSKRLKNFFYSTRNHDLKQITHKLTFFISYIKSTPPSFFNTFSEDILEFYSNKLKLNSLI